MTCKDCVDAHELLYKIRPNDSPDIKWRKQQNLRQEVCDACSRHLCTSCHKNPRRIEGGVSAKMCQECSNQKGSCSKPKGLNLSMDTLHDLFSKCDHVVPLNRMCTTCEQILPCAMFNSNSRKECRRCQSERKTAKTAQKVNRLKKVLKLQDDQSKLNCHNCDKYYTLPRFLYILNLPKAATSSPICEVCYKTQQKQTNTCKECKQKKAISQFYLSSNCCMECSQKHRDAKKKPKKTEQQREAMKREKQIRRNQADAKRSKRRQEIKELLKVSARQDLLDQNLVTSDELLKYDKYIVYRAGQKRQRQADKQANNERYNHDLKQSRKRQKIRTKRAQNMRANLEELQQKHPDLQPQELVSQLPPLQQSAYHQKQRKKSLHGIEFDSQCGRNRRGCPKIWFGNTKKGVRKWMKPNSRKRLKRHIPKRVLNATELSVV